jgi:hypothetical protein
MSFYSVFQSPEVLKSRELLESQTLSDLQIDQEIAKIERHLDADELEDKIIRYESIRYLTQKAKKDHRALDNRINILKQELKRKWNSSKRSNCC